METNNQLVNFMFTLIIGGMLGSIFDFYRVMRGVCRPKLIMTMIFDGLYWLIAFVVTFSCLIYSNWVEMRFYIFIGIITGWLIYYKLLSKYIVLCMVKIIRFLMTVNAYFRTIITSCLIKPLGYCIGVFLLPFRYCDKKIRNMEIIIKKRFNNQKKMTKK